MLRTMGLLAGLLLASCQEYGVQDRPGAGASGADIEVDPLSLTLGPATERVVGTFSVKNVGSAALDVSALELVAGEMAFTVVDDGTGGVFEVAPGEAHEVQVAFEPSSPLVYGQIEVRSDDPDEPVVTVDLQGLGEVPALQISPDSHVFPTLCDDTVVLTLANVGVADLEITGLTYDTPKPDLTLLSDLALPLTLAPDASAQVAVHYQPVSGEPVLGVLSVESNDPRGILTADQSSEASAGDVTESFVVEANPQIDVLFAIDKSGSMTDDARRLGQTFGDFIAQVGSVTTDWQIGVVTKDSGCFNNGIITASTPNYADVFLDAVDGLQIFADADLTEALLAMTDVSLTETGPSGCNVGFRRPGALLHVVTVSDEPEQSGQPYDYWLNRWQGQLADPNQLVVSAIVPTGGCSGDGTGYIEAANATGGLVLDLCSRNWSSFATQLGSASAQGLLTFLLSSLPDPSTIVVEVDGVAYDVGWHYDPVRNAVVIDAELPDGAQVEITYTSIGC
ncbi:MAG: choice-of-anchor D domain-containing protein [Myxococcota bacterium]